MDDQKAAVKLGVSSCLAAILGPDQRARKFAEEDLKTLEVTEEFGVILAEMMASDESPIEYRQLASIILKQYIEGHWNKLSAKFQEPELQEKTKTAIRELLPLCLGDSQSKVRATVAYAISAIAYWDWPEDWPNLFDQLVLSLESGSPNLVHGAMRVLTEFCQDVSDTQVPHVAHAILPYLLKVMTQREIYSVHTRTRAVHIYNLLSGLIFTTSMSIPDAARVILLPSISDYLHAFVDILSSELPSNRDHALRKEVIMTLCHLLRSFTQTLTPHIMTVVTPVWKILTRGTTVYLNSVVNSEQLVEEVYDSDGEVISQETEIFAVFEFINVLGESSHLQELLVPIMPQLVYLLLVHMQVTQEQFSCWMGSVSQFVDEDENEFSYSIRLSALDLIQSFTEEPNLSRPCYSAIVHAVNKHLDENPVNSSSHWWKVHEACYLVSGLLVEGLKSEEVEFDMENFVEKVVLADITADTSSLLSGRCLWLTGKASSLLSPAILLKCMEIVGNAIQPSQKPVLRILAAKSVFYFCSELKDTGHAQLLGTWLTGYLNSLCQLASESPEDVVFLVVDSLQLVSRMDMTVTAQCCSNIVPLAMSLFVQYSHDPGISSCVEELFEALSLNPGCHNSLHSQIFPTAVEILGSLSPQMNLGLVAAVLDVLVHIVRGSAVEGGAGLPSTFIQQIFPIAVKKILESSDSAVLQNGGECIRAFVSVSVGQLAAWSDSEGRDGLHYVVETILHLLDPLMPEFSASFVGRLIIVFVKKAGTALGQDFELLLRAVLSKMQSVSTPNVMQSLLLVFAQLIQTEMENVLSFLSNVPDPSGKPALNYVISEWCLRHPFFFGVYETRVSTLALCQLLSHCISTGDHRLTGMLLAGEEIVPEGQGIQTRSQRAALPPRWSEVTLPVKIVKLLVSDLQHCMECTVEDDLYSNELDGEDREEGLEGTLERLLATAAASGCDGWEVEDDPDLRDEPIMHLDLQAHLSKYLMELTQQPCFVSFNNYLTPAEQLTLTKLPS